MDQARVEFLLDDGWVLVGRIHQWLSEFPALKSGRESVIELIGGLQHLWALSDDLKLKRVSRVCLGLEQLLERYCSRNLAFSAEELKEVLTANVTCLQEMMLGLEATREEPEIADPECVRQLERFSLQTLMYPVTEMISVEPDVTAIPFELSIESTDATGVIPLQEPPVEHEVVNQNSVDDGLLTMLEQFVAQLDETCHRLHVRSVADESPYVTTTSRLEHLATSTRELVDQIASRSRGTSSGQDVLTFTDSPNIAASPHIAALSDTEAFRSSSELPLLTEQATSTPNEPPSLEDAIEFHIAEQPSDIPNVYEPAPVADQVTLPSHRVLIVEESLFFRHLICMVVQSAGFEPCMVESVTQGLETLEQSEDFSAILIGETVSAELAQVIAQRRQAHGLKVIGLVQANLESSNLEGIDDHVLRSQPQQLVSILNTLFSQSAEPMRLSA